MMTGRRPRFRHADLVRAVKAVTAAGVGVARIEIDEGGKIVIVPGRPPQPTDEVSSQDDIWLARARRELAHEVE